MENEKNWYLSHYDYELETWVYFGYKPGEEESAPQELVECIAGSGKELSDGLPAGILQHFKHSSTNVRNNFLHHGTTTDTRIELAEEAVK